jgi:hypothetical protein
LTTNKTKTEQQLTLDIEKETIAPHPLLEAAYTSENALELWTDRDFKPFFVNSKRVRLAAKGSGQPLRFAVHSLVRKVIGEDQFFYGLVTTSSKDYFGNYVSAENEIGIIRDYPTISRTYGINVAQIKTSVSPDNMRPQASAPFISDTTTKYTIPFAQAHDQILKWKKDKTIIPTAKYYLSVDEMKYSINNFQDWLNLSVTDLILLNRAGNRFESLYDHGDPSSLAKVKAIVRSELEKNITNKI